jgi:hypothetical protein
MDINYDNYWSSHYGTLRFFIATNPYNRASVYSLNPEQQ